MQTLFLIKDYEDKKIGEKIAVENNIAHSLIEKGVAVLAKPRSFLRIKEIEKPVKDKMIRKKKTKFIEL